MNNLEKVAAIMNDIIPDNVHVTVEKTWRDFGANISWETLICTRYGFTPTGKACNDSYQMLYVKDWEAIRDAKDYDALVDIAHNVLLRQENLIWR